MIYRDVVIVGGGPAGSTCGWKLKQAGIECIILDRKTFPRTKPCAGWITPRVVTNLDMDLEEYPYGVVSFEKIFFHFYGKRFTIKTLQHSIRRCEFDHWLLERSGVPVHHHRVRGIEKDRRGYIVDNQYCCKYLVGAAGTYCPVYRTLFNSDNSHSGEFLVTTMEEEFAFEYEDPNCYIWFFDTGLPGYAWYVPKGDGFLNIGIGGLLGKLKKRHSNIRSQWDSFVRKLEKLSLVRSRRFSPKGHNYYLRQRTQVGRIGNAYVVGDSAGLATRDLGEGIGPAVESGLLAADSIINGNGYSLKSVTKYSFIEMFLAGIRRTK